MYFIKRDLHLHKLNSMGLKYSQHPAILFKKYEYLILEVIYVYAQTYTLLNSQNNLNSYN